ncbi:MAG: NusG domain II-containing protein [Fibrobacterota bacterium]|nr:NusG domain II-containing protein [Fibrobacterota bacterium]
MFSPRTFFRPLDAILILTVSAAAGWGLLAFRISEGTKAVVHVGNKKYGWYELSSSRHRVFVSTHIGPMELEIGGGSARVVSSPCRNKICVKTGAISRSHSEIVCMPARMVVILESEGADADGSGEGTDAVTF